MVNFNEYPYRNLTDLNLDYLEKRMKVLEEIIDTFVTLNTLTFADPIIWNITTQYARNTVVLDTAGNAYLSKDAVPAGVQLNNEDYWLEIFNFTEYTRTANQNLTINVETNTTRATAAYSIDDWLIWNDVLYKVTAAIAIDDTLIIGTNIVHFTVEDFIKAFMTWATNTIQQYKTDIDASELQYKNEIDASEAGYQLAMQAQVDRILAGATVDSEVIDARLGANGVNYATLGLAIRSQVDLLNGSIDDVDSKTTDNTNILTSLMIPENIYNKNSNYIVSGEIIDGGGVITPVANWSHLIIPIVGGRKLSINKRVFICYYSKGEVVTGGGDTSSPSVRDIPAGVDSIAISVSDTDKITLRICYSDYLKSDYISYGVSKVTDNLDVYNKQTTDRLFELFELAPQNLFYPPDIVEGYFIVNDGTRQANANWCYCKIPVEPDTDYSVTGARRLSCYYDGNTVVSGGHDTSQNEIIHTPSNVNVIAISTQIADRNTIYVAKSSTAITLDDTKTNPSSRLNVYNKEEIDALVGGGAENVITVTSSDNLRTVLESITDASRSKKYIVAIEEGTYDIESYYTAAEIASTSFRGLVVPDYVKLYGLGNRENIIIKWNNLGSGLGRVSPLNLKAHSELENLRIEAHGVRYCLHDEYVNYPVTIQEMSDDYYKVINCHLVADNTVLGYCLGIGLGSGERREYKDCIFEVLNNAGCVYMHNNLRFTQSAHVRYVNCIFKTLGTRALAIRSLTNNTHVYNYAELIGNDFNGLGIIAGPDNASSTGDGNLFKIEGYANTPVNVTFDNTDGVDYSGDVSLH